MKKHFLSSLIIFTLLMTAMAGAQTQNVAYIKKDSNPVGSSNAFPWGSDGIRYQCIFLQSTLGGLKPAVINDILVAGSKADNVISYGDIEIRMGITTATTPAASWQTNNPNPTTVYRGKLRIRINLGKWNGIGLPNSYIYLPKTPADNLCVEVIIRKVDDRGSQGTTASNFYSITAGSIPRAFLYQWATKPPQAPLTGTSLGAKMGLVLMSGNVAEVGRGCNGPTATEQRLTVNSYPQLGKPLTVNLLNGYPKSAALLFIGYNEQTWGALTLPFDLTPFGAKGCKIWHAPLTFLAAPVLTNGTATLPLGIPNSSSLGGVRLNIGWLNIHPPANPIGFITSSPARMVIGP